MTKSMLSFAWALALATTLPAMAQNAAIPPGPGNCGPQYPGYALQTYRDYESQMVAWYQRFNAAPSGSPDEAYARNQMQFNGDRALGAISNVGALVSYSSTELENFAVETGQKYNAAPSGSYLEQVYRQVVGLGWNAYVQSSSNELYCLGAYDWNSSVRLGALATNKYNAAPSGSAAERAYSQVAQASWQRALAQVQSLESSPYEDFRSLENVGIQFARGYDQSPSGSAAERFYQQAYQISFNASLNRFRSQVKYISTNDLYNVVAEYERKYNAAPSGSAYERLTRSIRDESRIELNTRGTYPPNPYPPYPPNPYPPTPPTPYPPNPYPPTPPTPYPPNPYPPTPGRVSCTVTTQRTGYSGFGVNEVQALAAARNECIKWETNFACVQAPYVCRSR